MLYYLILFACILLYARLHLDTLKKKSDSMRGGLQALSKFQYNPGPEFVDEVRGPWTEAMMTEIRINRKPFYSPPSEAYDLLYSPPSK